MLVYSWATSDVGRKRSHNEDRYLVAHDVGLFAVADGMGGHNAGEVAADLAVRVLDGFVHLHRRRLEGDAAGLLKDAIVRANAVVHDAGSGPATRGMGTTTTSLLFAAGRALVGHVGDSRAYLVRGGRIVQVSRDHSLVAEQMRAGVITAEQAKVSPWKNVITRCVGSAAVVDVDVAVVDLEDGDTFLLCSDGLSGLVSDEEICCSVVEQFLHRVPDVLVDLANERGGHDNITVVVCHVVADAH
ncbi:MAG: Stp1/IreP family PP2C-type Ser/Thr phosphatase [Deltaproteobacteria bacterium]|nr:Stp1/IreP family PP2C-type Ser/Thr phosphatase [Deltaproteobacteria bacterium]